MDKTVDSRLAQCLKDRETLIGSSPRAARKPGIHTRPRAAAAHGSTVTSTDGSALNVDAVVWATGFRLDHSFIELPVFDDRGRATHPRGVTDIPGLYFLGLPWQYTRGSALLGWVKDDAQYITERIDAFAQASAAAAAQVPARAGLMTDATARMYISGPGCRA
jgi:putative flavoprotein involved in K+ transport